MDENLAVLPSKSKPFRWTRSDVRLLGWCGWLLKRSKKPWVHLCLPKFCKATGIGLRTAKRSLQKIRTSPKSEIIARTINEKGVWKVLVSSSSRLHGLKRTEPFTKDTQGNVTRIIKDQIRGEQITEEQLVIGADPILWKAKPKQFIKSQLLSNPPDSKSDSPGQLNFEHLHDTHAVKKNLLLTTDQEVGGSIDSSFSNTQTGNVWQTNRECHFSYKYIRDNTSGVIKFKHGQADFGVKTRNLAWYIARNDLRNEHWDNCKVAHTMNHSFTYALQALRRGCNRRTITKAYSMALEEIHAVAVDSGVTEPASWQPSSTISRARTILRNGGCHGQWSRRVARLNNSNEVIVSADSQSAGRSREF